ncbi:hypothetical protein NLI96_g6720 [Meripilus lineatus]|uniref:CHAT domain-containing protein n=1 Tax=Meripilus lineatus TaxID=2056292 RepID=A0AAD5V129_9APHY|nr:hypothetical protein NLI96_g6720 [Physisporinus lineatus]
MSLSELANAYAKRFEHNGDPRNLDLTIKYCHEAVDIAPLKYGQDPTFLARIGDAYLQRYISRGNVEDLDLGIDYLRKAVEVSPKDFIHRFPAIGFLGRALTIRFELRKDRRDVEEAVIRTHQCMGVYSRGHPGRLIAFGDRGTALLNRYRSRNYPDVVQLKHVPEDSQKSPGHPSQALLRHPFPEGDDLESAIDDFRESLQLCPEGHPWHGRVLYNLADALLTRYEGSRRLIDQNNAQRYLESAQALLHKDDPILGMIFFASAREHLLRFESDYVDDAFSLYEKASTHRTLGTRQKLTGALSWVAAAEKYKHSSSLAAYKQTFILLDQQLNVVTDVLARHRIRKRLATNPTNAAACAINLGENDTAIELLEQGRGMLWMQLARLRTPIEDLRKLGPEEATLADRFEELSKVLDAGVTTIYRPISSEKSEDARERTANKHREVSERWEATVAEIRCIPGFTHFLQATPYSDLRDAAKEGPVVVFNINERRSDALVVSDAGAPYAIQLPHATPKTLASLSSHLSDVLAKTRAESDERYRTNQVVLVLRELWNVVIYPIVQYLLTSVQRKSRIWLCPTAELCSLPIHAAGQYRAKGTNLPDIFVCSYTPTLSALIRARQLPSDPEAPDITPAMLAIGESNDNVRGGETTLLSLSKEIEQLMDILPSHIPHRELLNTDATPEAVLQALHEHTWVHLACHGVQEPTQPFYSHFLLHGNSLRLLDVIQADLKHVKFAFTSACHTAVGDKNTSDEVIHLAAALQFAGFKSVVGTMWGMDDRDGPQITAEFYRAMFSEEKSMDHTEAANALNAAVKKMKKNKVSVDRRAVFIHIGA